MKLSTSIASGVAGATAVTLIHETVKRIDPKAPRMDLLGMNALSKVLKSVGKNPPKGDKLYAWTLVGDVVSNSLYYSLAGVGKKKGALLRGGLLGLAAGLGAVLLPRPLGLNESHSTRSTQTSIMTVALYVVGGLATAAILRALNKEEEESPDPTYDIYND